jgi:hypothetical protein
VLWFPIAHIVGLKKLMNRLIKKLKPQWNKWNYKIDYNYNCIFLF